MLEKKLDKRAIYIWRIYRSKALKLQSYRKPEQTEIKNNTYIDFTIGTQSLRKLKGMKKAGTTVKEAAVAKKETWSRSESGIL